MDDRVSQIAGEIESSVPDILSSWRESRDVRYDEDHERLEEGAQRLTLAFAEFLKSLDTVETFSRGGATRESIHEMARRQRAIERDAVGVMEDFASLRRAIWSVVEERVDLSKLSGGEVARFFAKLMQASDWATETGLQAFEAIVREDMEEVLGRAAATDLLTGLPDRDLFSRVLLPRALEESEVLSVVVFDVVDFSATVAAGEVARARNIVHRLAVVVKERIPGEVARFGDDEVCALVPDLGSEELYRMVERVLEELALESEPFQVDAGLAEYPTHASDAARLINEMLSALKMAKRVGGGGIVIAR